MRIDLRLAIAYVSAYRLQRLAVARRWHLDAAAVAPAGDSDCEIEQSHRCVVYTLFFPLGWRRHNWLLEMATGGISTPLLVTVAASELAARPGI